VFHVDYWNNLGWVDGLSSEAMTKRQVDVSKLWEQPSVYTPAVVLDGREWRDWRDAQSPGSSNSNSSKIKLNIFRETDGSLTVKVERPKNDRRFVVRLAQLGMGLSTNVTGGENSGQLLKHNFVVLKWDSKAFGPSQTEENFKLQPTKQKAPQNAVAVWIEEEGNPTPLQATGGYL